MPKYSFLARDRAGKRVVGSEEAASQQEVVNRLQSRGLIVIKISVTHKESLIKKKAASEKKSIKFSHRGIKPVDKVNFARQLSTMIGAGVSVLKSLEVISVQLESARFHRVVLKICEDVRNGYSLHKAFAKHLSVFDNLWVNLIETGEASGNLAIVLDRLANYLESREEFKQKLISAVIYPIIILLAAIGALLFFLLKIIPMFSNLYQQIDAQMPALTMFIFNLSNLVKRLFIPGILILAASIFFLRQYIKTESGKRQMDNLKFRLPVLSGIVKKLAIERFTSEMATLVSSGVPILYSLEIVERSSDNTIMRDSIHKIKESVRDGKLLAEPLGKSGLFPPMVVQMVAIGEEIGELPQMLKRLQSYYTQMISTFLTRFASVFEPFLLIFVGIIIGFLVVSMFLPLFQIATSGMNA